MVIVLNCAVVVLLVAIDIASVVKGSRIVRIQLNGFVIVLDRSVVVSLATVCISTAVEGIGIVWLRPGLGRFFRGRRL